VEVLKKKSEALEVFKAFKAKVEKKHRRSIKALRTDGGGEYTSKEFAAFLRKNGIEKEITAPYTPQENIVSERANQTIVGRAGCMLFDAGLAKKFWAEAVRTAVYLKNFSMTVAVTGNTPFEAWHGSKPDLRHLRVFGCLAFIRAPKEKRRKWDNQAIQGIFIGYYSTTKQYRVYDPATARLHTSRDVVFRENDRYVLLQQGAA
jgi:hypothetical protein